LPPNEAITFSRPFDARRRRVDRIAMVFRYRHELDRRALRVTIVRLFNLTLIVTRPRHALAAGTAGGRPSLPATTYRNGRLRSRFGFTRALSEVGLARFVRKLWSAPTVVPIAFRAISRAWYVTDVRRLSRPAETAWSPTGAGAAASGVREPYAVVVPYSK